MHKSIPSWTDSDPRRSFSPLTTNADVDVVIIGAGIAGLTTAYLLTKEGRKVMVLDDGPIASGETERTTAHLSYVLGTRYAELEKIHGVDGAKLIAQSHSAAIDRIEAIVQSEKIDCDFRRVSGYLFPANDDGDKELKKELDAVHRAGKTDVQYVANLTETDSAALHFPQQGQLHVLRYISGLADAVTKNGGTIHGKTRVLSFESKAGFCTLRTENGYSVKSGYVIVATNAPIHDNVQIYAKQAAYRTFVIAARIAKNAMKPILLWDTQDPYHYVRIQEGEKEDFLIVGGEDHKTGHKNDAELRFANLERWARARFPFMSDIAYHWSGQVMESYDGIAMIGNMPMQDKNIFICTGDSGNGMTHGTIAGMLLTDILSDRSNPWREIYNPSRLRLRAGKDLLTENTSTGTAAVCGWVATGGPKEESVKPGTGAVFSRGTKKIALYIDEAGAKHEFSAVCPHRKCIVQWNSFEKSFDCPCHGSRFACDGTPLNGPVVSGLTPVHSASEKKA